jgi:hypothetical protein
MAQAAGLAAELCRGPPRAAPLGPPGALRRGCRSAGGAARLPARRPGHGRAPAAPATVPRSRRPAAGDRSATGTPPRRAATQASAAALPPGATVGAAGLTTMPFEFAFEGGFFRLQDFLGRLDRFTKVRGEDISVRGRLLTVDGLLPLVHGPVVRDDDRQRARHRVPRAGRRGPHRRRHARRARHRRVVRRSRRRRRRRPDPDPGLRGHGRLIRMGFLRNVVTDLVEKRLWPVALLLVLAIVAVPVVLSRTAPEAPVAAAPPGAPAPVPTSRGQITAAVPVPVNRERTGPLRDPFRRPKAAAADTTPSSVTATPPVPSPSPSPDPGPWTRRPRRRRPPPAAARPPATAPVEPSTRPSPPRPKADPLDAYRITLRFGEAGKVKTRRDLARLTPLPSADDPFFVFLGVLDGGKRAVFLVSADATPTGDGICKPRPTACETIELRVGDTEFFDLERPSGPVQYELQLRSIRKDGEVSPAEAVAARARASEAGAEVLRAADAGAVDGLDGYRFSRGTGLLQRTAVASRARAGSRDEAGPDAEPTAASAAGAPVAGPLGAAASAAAADADPVARRQDERTRAAVRAIVSGVAGALPARR